MRAQVTDDGHEPYARDRQRQIRQPVGKWRDGLINLTGSNRLLNFKPSKTGMVGVVRPSPGEVLSQRACIAAALDGRSFVMDGPPGTGKSQTIANMIGVLLHAGKTVLFVSEKAAALDVVRDRLDAAGLRPYLLELHSHKATRKQVAVELELALALVRLVQDAGGVSQDELTTRVARLYGWARRGPDITARMQALIRVLREKDTLSGSDDNLTLRHNLLCPRCMGGSCKAGDLLVGRLEGAA
jgi:hypothetical protein